MSLPSPVPSQYIPLRPAIGLLRGEVFGYFLMTVPHPTRVSVCAMPPGPPTFIQSFGVNPPEQNIGLGHDAHWHFNQDLGPLSSLDPRS